MTAYSRAAAITRDSFMSWPADAQHRRAHRTRAIAHRLARPVVTLGCAAEIYDWRRDIPGVTFNFLKGDLTECGPNAVSRVNTPARSENMSREPLREHLREYLREELRDGGRMVAAGKVTNQATHQATRQVTVEPQIAELWWTR